MALAHKIPVEVATGTMALLVVFGSPRNILPKPCKPSKLLKKKRQDSYDLFVKPLQKETSKPPDSLNPKPLWPFKNLKAPPPPIFQVALSGRLRRRQLSRALRPWSSSEFLDPRGFGSIGFIGLVGFIGFVGLIGIIVGL